MVQVTQARSFSVAMVAADGMAGEEGELLPALHREVRARVLAQERAARRVQDRAPALVSILRHNDLQAGIPIAADPCAALPRRLIQAVQSRRAGQ
jgi:hypothetical protein